MTRLGVPVCDRCGRHCTCDDDHGQFGYDDGYDGDDYYADHAEDAMIGGWDEGLSR